MTNLRDSARVVAVAGETFVLIDRDALRVVARDTVLTLAADREGGQFDGRGRAPLSLTAPRPPPPPPPTSGPPRLGVSLPDHQPPAVLVDLVSMGIDGLKHCSIDQRARTPPGCAAGRRG